MTYRESKSPSPYLGEPVHIEARPLPEAFEEPSDRWPIRPYEPTPGNPYCEEVQDHQKLVFDSLYRLVSDLAPVETPEPVRRMIEMDYLAGQAQRSDKNFCAFSKWLTYKKEHQVVLSPALKAMEDEQQLGIASPNTVLSFMSHAVIEEDTGNYALESAELTKITHPYRYRMNHIVPARSATTTGIRANGGVVYPTVGTLYRKIDIQPNVESITHRDERWRYSFEENLRGFFVTYKRDVGHVTRDDGRRIQIIERQAAAIRIDPMVNLPEDIVKRIKAVDGIGVDEGWKKRLVAETGLAEHIEEQIQNNRLPDYIEPLSTMQYAAVESEETYLCRIAEHARRLHDRDKWPATEARILGALGVGLSSVDE